MDITVRFVVWLALLCGGVVTALQRAPHSILTEELISNYGPTTARPVADLGTPTTVKIGLVIQQVIDLYEKDQTLKLSVFRTLTWQDEFLCWNTTAYPQVPFIKVPSSAIWRPPIHLFENVDEDYSYRKVTSDIDMIVLPDGSVYWETPAILSTSCRIDARKFPFDTQRCILRFVPWGESSDGIDLHPPPVNGSIPSGQFFVKNGVWEFDGLSVERILSNYTGSDQLYSEVAYTVSLKRRSLFHVLSFILPCALLSCLNLLVFILPTESGEKVSFGITNLLSLVLFQQLVSESLPPASDNMPFIMNYFTPMIFVASLSVSSGVVTAILYYQKKTRPIPSWIRKLTALISSPRARCDNTTPTTNSSASDEASTDVMKLKKPIGASAVLNTAVYPESERKNVAFEENEEPRCCETESDYSVEWQKAAVACDRFFLALALTITFVSVIVTIILFQTTP